jgi:hypothetical protein
MYHRTLPVLIIGLLLSSPLIAVDYYVLPSGDDPATGRVEVSYAYINGRSFLPGDRLFFRRGETYTGRLRLEQESGSAGNPIIVLPYGDAPERPLIDAGGSSVGVDISYSDHLEIHGLEITGGGVDASTWGSWGPWERAFPYIRLIDLHIRDVSGDGINFIVTNENDEYYRDVEIRDCLIENAGGYGIRMNKWSQTNPIRHEDIRILNNTIRNAREAGMQVGKIYNGLIEGNHVSQVGNDDNGNGSGLWTWYCEDFYIQHNVFMDGRGVTDACGVHIDIGCVNNVVQYNLSMNNEGGFAQILGRARNCVYRYNISINDGSRVLGENGAALHGRTLYLGGWVGRENGVPLPPEGPYNSYVYNNTIFVKADIVSKYEMQSSAEGALFANNVIYVAGTAEAVLGSGGDPQTIIFENNLVFQGKVPSAPFTAFINNLEGDPQFANPGGLVATDYLPSNLDQILDRSIPIYPVPGDEFGVIDGAEVEFDFFGRPIHGTPDLGAIEFSGAVHWLEGQGIDGLTPLTSDLNGDGVSLLLAYALGLNPEEDLANQLPTWVMDGAQAKAEIRFPGRASGIDYRIETSEDLESWETSSDVAISEPDEAGLREAVVDLPSAGPAFYRLRVEEKAIVPVAP